MTNTVVSNGTTSTGVTVTSGNELEVASGGTASGTIVQSGGIEQVDVGGVDSAATISAGGSALILGSASNDSIFGTVIVSNGTAVVTNETVFGGGSLNLNLAGTVASGTTINSGGALNISGRGDAINTVVNGGGIITLQSGKATLSGTITLTGSNNQIQVLSGITSPISGGSSFGDQAVITGFAASAGDILDVRALSGGTVVLTTSGANTVATLSGTSGSTAVTEAFILSGGNANYSDLRAVSDGQGGTEIVCFVAGTRIRTDNGDVAIELLSVGDLVVTTSGETRPIKWLGHRTVFCQRHVRPEHVWPVRIDAHAFGTNRPARDLWVSPSHTICVDVVGEVLIPASALVNGATIQQVDVDTVTYWHVELESHDVILAENLPAESYLDAGNRNFFAESDVIDFHAIPDARLEKGHSIDFCRPVYNDCALVDIVRGRLRTQAERLGWTRDETPFANLHVVYSGVRIRPLIEKTSAIFILEGDARDVWLVCDTAAPRFVSNGQDRRTLGVCLSGLFVDDGCGKPLTIDIADPLLHSGFHDVERQDGASWRWTNGRALLPAALFTGRSGPYRLRIELAAGAIPRWVAPYGSTKQETRSKSKVSNVYLAAKAARVDPLTGVSSRVSWMTKVAKVFGHRSTLVTSLDQDGRSNTIEPEPMRAGSRGR